MQRVSSSRSRWFLNVNLIHFIGLRKHRLYNLVKDVPSNITVILASALFYEHFYHQISNKYIGIDIQNFQLIKCLLMTSKGGLNGVYFIQFYVFEQVLASLKITLKSTRGFNVGAVGKSIYTVVR